MASNTGYLKLKHFWYYRTPPTQIWQYKNKDDIYTTGNDHKTYSKKDYALDNNIKLS